MPPTLDSAGFMQKFTGPVGVRVRALLALCMVFGIGAVGTLALWSNSAGATSGEFKTGLLDLRVNTVKAYVFTGSPGFNMANMIPGESRAATLAVQNTLSSLPLTYTVSASTPTGSPALANHLELAVFTGTAVANGTSSGLNTGSCSGIRLGGAPLRSAASVSVVTTPQPLGQGVNPGSIPSAQDLCIVVTLSPAAPISVQNQTVASITLTFDATST